MASPPTSLADPVDIESAGQGAPTLVAAALGGQRGDRPLFRRLDLTLPPGRIVWLRGRNGRGKTTLLRLLAGLSAPARGTVEFGGHAVRGLPSALRSRLLYVAHNNALKDDLTVREALTFLGQLQGRRPQAAEVDTALAALGVQRLRDATVRTLSQGQRRRASLARLALPQPPSAWLLDEPFDALDDDGVRALHALLAAQVRRGGSVLMTSHQDPGLGAAVATLDLDAFAVGS